MERRHIAVFTPLVAGHVYPLLGLCSELVSRGHRVTYPANESFAAKIRETGAEVIDFKVPEMRYAEKVIQCPLPDDSKYSKYWRLFVSIYCPMWIATVAAMVSELEVFYEANPPNVILYDSFSFAGRILARQCRCPAIQVWAHFAHRESIMRVDGICTNPEPMIAFGQLLDCLMSAYGFEGRGHLWHLERMNIIFIPREFQYDADSFDSRFKFVGATHNRRPGAAVWKNGAEDGKPLLLISENTASRDDRFFKLCVEAFAESQYHVVFSKGLNSTEIPSELLPSNFEINREAFNRDILPFADVMLCQGGMGTTLESLYHGVPVVAVPPNPFNAEVAYRLAEMGLGIHVPEGGMTSSILKQAVDAISSDEALLRRVRCMQSRLKGNHGAEPAADAIEELLT